MTGVIWRDNATPGKSFLDYRYNAHVIVNHRARRRRR